MRGIKTYLIGLLIVLWGIAGCFQKIPVEIWFGVALALIGLAFITARLGLRSSWAGAYKVYVREEKAKKVFRHLMPTIRGDNIES